MERILVIGSPGSGKSTLATELARKTGLPLIHLDQEHWRPGWVEPSKEEWQQQLRALVARDRWIIDGNYSGSLEMRLVRADTVVDLEYPAWLCLWRLLHRIVSTRGRVRPDMAEGCPEQFNLGFVFYTATFPYARRKRTLAKLSRFNGKIIRLRSPAEARRFLASFDQRG
jgi:adenylate kinase family enzyme